jgi:phosphonate transport system substrate-binding protein
MPGRSIISSLLLFVYLAVLTLGLFAAEEGTPKQVYTVGVVPQIDARHLHEIWLPILDDLEIALGVKFVLKGSPSIPAFEQDFMAGKFDFAYMNPYHALMANNSQGYIPLVRDVGKALSGVLVVRRDSPIKKVQQLAGKELAFPAPNAVAASLLIRVDLNDKFHVQITPRYVRSHSSVYLNVALGKAIAGGGVQKTLQQQSLSLRKQLRVLYRTQDIAAHPFVAHPRVPKRICEQVRRELLQLGKTQEGRQLLESVPIKKIGIATIDDYKPLSKMNLERFVVRE